MTLPAINFQDVSARYGRHQALQDVSVTVAPGSLLAVAGPNGAGKSTFLKLAAGLLRPSAGTVQAPSTLAYLPQASTLQRDMPLTVLQAVCTAYWPVLGNWGEIDQDRQDKARAALHEVGLMGFETRQLSALSGGQFQRLLFARLILQDATTILLDEPFAAIDTTTTKVLLQLIQSWHREGRTILCVLHDLGLVRRYFPQLLLLDTTCRGYGATTDLAAAGLLMDEI